ncbi:hypothetical protein [Crocinitomix catalasitica]|uniref:hypothetical protein n=1 Tax=Crocinitomix catalasitica TaxID=184607 RepID=UPI000484DB58|nr:hypothetical protein [Crocinitomix catalasitica]
MKQINIYKLSFWLITITLFALTTHITLSGILLWATGGFVIVVSIAYIISAIFYAIAKKQLSKIDAQPNSKYWSWASFILFTLINTILITLEIIEINQDHHWAFG